MLQNFFKLNEPWKEIADEDVFVEHFTLSNDLRNVLYRPDRLSPRSPYRLKSKTFENVSFSKTVVERVVFRECSFVDCLFIGTTFRKCEFHSCTFIGCNPHKIIFEESYIDPKCFKNLLDPYNQTNIGLHLFNQLEQNARKQEQYQFISSAAFLYRRWRRYHLNWEYSQGHIKKWSYVFKWTPDYVYDLVAGYGWKVQNFIISSIAFILIISLCNHFFWDYLGMSGSNLKGGSN